MSRLEYNRKLLKELESYIENNPNLRFIQALWGMKIIDSEILLDSNCDTRIIDRFFEESKQTLKRIKNE